MVFKDRGLDNTKDGLKVLLVVPIIFFENIISGMEVASDSSNYQ